MCYASEGEKYELRQEKYLTEGFCQRPEAGGSACFHSCTHLSSYWCFPQASDLNPFLPVYNIFNLNDCMSTSQNHDFGAATRPRTEHEDQNDSTSPFQVVLSKSASSQA